jgi:hypothetical protein
MNLYIVRWTLNGLGFESLVSAEEVTDAHHTILQAQPGAKVVSSVGLGLQQEREVLFTRMI